MTTLLQVAGGLAMIAGLLALQVLALYLIWRVVMVAVSFFPLVGKKHRHRHWSRLNRR